MTIRERLNAYSELTKPRITWLILLSTAIGYSFGLQAEVIASPNLVLFLSALLGTGLIASGTAALNQWYEWQADSRMARTQARPIPSGRVSRREALLFALLLSVVGLAQLFVFVNPLTGWLGLFTMVSYLGVYTPLKQVTPHSTTLGAIPGAMPPLLGYAAAHGSLTLEAWVLYAILFLWQFPHFYSIAWMYREDYGRAGIRMLPVVEPDGISTVRQILFFLVLLVPVSLMPSLLDMTGRLYLVGAALLGVYFFRAGIRIARNRTPVEARSVLLASVLYLPALYGLMLIDRA